MSFLFGFSKDILRFSAVIIVYVFSLSFHECSHAYVANLLKDPTAKERGRLTLNPLKHIDVFGIICVILFKVGWAKPVPIDINNFSKPKRDMAIVAIFGPISNFVLFFLGSIFFKIYRLFIMKNVNVYVGYFLYIFFSCLIFLNISLCIFNLIPIPPLDGSRIFMCFLRDKAYYFVMKYESIGGIVVFLLFLNKNFKKAFFDMVSFFAEFFYF